MRRCSFWGTGFGTFVALSALACGAGSHAAAPPPHPRALAKPAVPPLLPAPSAERALSPHDTISVLSAAQVPATLQVDGDLGEWSVFAEGKPTPLTPSFVAAAATADSVVLFGRVRNLAEQGLWLWLQNEVPEFPPIGTYQRGGSIMPLQCDLPEDQRMYAPFDDESCRSLLQHHEELQKAFAATFMRQLHLTAQAVSVRTGARDAPIANAQYAARTDGGAVSFEVRLPLSALPRTADNEIASFSVTVERAGAATPSEPNPNALASVSFGTPIRFGLDSEVLTCLLQNVTGLMPLTPRFSYQPGTPNQVFRVANQGGYAIETTEVTLSTREGGLGAVEVRAVNGASTFAAILKDGHLVECASVGNILGVVERGKGLHIIGYNEGIEESVGAPYLYYSVVEIDKDGAPQYEELLEASQEGFLYSSVGGDHAKNLATFSVSGTYRTNDGGTQQHELLWRYDKRTNHYALKQRKGRYVPPTSSEPSYSDPQY